MELGGAIGSWWAGLVMLEAVGGSCGSWRFEWQQVGSLVDARSSRRELWDLEVRAAVKW